MMNLEITSHCWNCGLGLTSLDYGRGDSCQKCGKDTRVCKSCVFYDRSYNNECRESQADRVVEKEKSNFCDFFKPCQSRPGGQVAGGPKPQESLRASAEALFKKKES